jgi:hypothetical protein
MTAIAMPGDRYRALVMTAMSGPLVGPWMLRSRVPGLEHTVRMIIVREWVQKWQ